MPHRLGFESLVLLHHEFKDSWYVQDNNGNVHDDKSLLRIIDLACLRHPDQLLRAVAQHHLLQGIHVWSKVLCGQNGLNFTV